MAGKQTGSATRVFTLLSSLHAVLLLPVAADSADLERHSPPFNATNLVAMAQDRLLIWGSDGQAQIRDGNGSWTPVFRLPMREVLRITADGSGFLALGLSSSKVASDRFLVGAFDSSGKEVDRWTTEPAWALTADDSGRWVVTAAGSQIPLLPGGQLGPSEAIPQWQGQPPRAIRFSSIPLRWLRWHWHEATVYCHDADLAKEGAASARCERHGSDAWAYTGGWAIGDSAIACGPWLVMREGKRYEQLAVIDMASGKLSGRLSYRKKPVIACAGADELAIGSNRLELLRLPSMEIQWRSRLLPRPVLALAAMEHYLAYRLGPGFDILMTPRPQPPLHP